jgi:hypothetical protein
MSNLSIINYLPKVQAFDKSLAFLSSPRFHGAEILHILDLDLRTRNVAWNMWSFFFERVGGKVIIRVPETMRSESIYGFVDDYKVYDLRSDSEILAITEEKITQQQTQDCVLLSPYGKKTPFEGKIKQLLQSYKAEYWIYNKSLHDKRYGLSEKATNKFDTFWGQVKGFGKFLLDLQKKDNIIYERGWSKNVMFAFNSKHRSVLLKRGVPWWRIEIIGYPLAYPTWLNIAKERGTKISIGDRNKKKIILFTRGQSKGFTGDDSVVSNEMLIRLVSDILEILEEKIENWELLIKPHPYQDLGILEEFIGCNQCVIVTHEHPSVLAQDALIAIATYSSTIVDTIVANVPSIEYFHETPFFEEKHPGGSPFIEFGAYKARTKEELSNHIENIMKRNRMMN